MVFTSDRLSRFNTLIQSFFGSLVIPEGMIKLPLTVGTPPQRTTIHDNFLVVKLFSTYNAIFDCLSLWTLKAIVSSYDLMVKFSIKNGVGQIKGNQAMAQQCFAAKLKAEGQPTQAEVQLELPMGLDARDDLIEQHAQPTEDLLDVLLRKEDLNQMIKINSCLDEVTKSRLISLV